ncbi:MAG: aminopeptidase P family protein [Caedimonas sp.]|nr:aminopeptidase P family protein [Caedimonas sp.]
MTAQKLTQLRDLLDQQGVDGYLIPKADEHQCEYLRPDAERLQWLTRFSGSAGCAIVLKDRAALCVDGRYVLQAQYEADRILFEIVDTTYTAPTAWLVKNVPQGAKIGFDPWLMTHSAFKNYEKRLAEKEAFLIPLDHNLIDDLWQNKPPRCLSEMVIHPLEAAGMSHQEKLNDLSEKIRSQNADAALVTMVESVNWLFNIRGHDLAYMPVTFAFALIYREGRATMFADLAKVTPDVRDHLGERVEIRAYEDLLPALQELGRRGRTIMMDPALAPLKVITTLEQAGGRVLFADDPALLPKACKNETEIKGMRETHVRDGAALTMFLHWVTTEGVSRKVTEMEAAEKLHECRARWATFWGESFPTISAAGPHGAVIHYRATPATNRMLQMDDLYLVDSGGHYHDGSTDVTRTIALGHPTSEQKDRFTRVLKGHIALAQLIFPQGTTGGQLDAFARRFLWEAGLDYAHGTGHGVGSVLNIHEGPQGISKMPNRVPLQPGMIVSNEPGYYKPDHYGIRLESLLVVMAVDLPGAEHPMLGFETLTLAPVDLALIERSLMTPSEIEWLNAYHQRVFASLAPLIEPETKRWLYEVTRPL